LQTLLASDSYYKQQQSIAAATVGSVRKLWAGMTDDFDASWSVVAPRVLDVVQLGRTAAVTTSVGYTPRVLAETNQVAPQEGDLIPARFVENAPDGRPMESLLGQSVITAKVAVRDGATASAALTQAESWLTGMLLTVLADDGRAVVGADIVQRPQITGYTRMLNGTSCSRCLILAGRWYRWNDGFLRHDRCDCKHVASTSEALSTADKLRADPYAAFHAMSKAEQEKAFGRIEARAINDGADIYRVVNLKNRGLATAKGRLRFGTPSKLTVDDIYRTAGTRTNALKMLKDEGYITGPQVAGGNILGTGRAAQGFGALGKGGKARSASDAVLDANASGVRDPLNRYTMTAAERRLYDSQYRLNEARRTGNWPRSIGENTADKFSRPTPLAPGDLDTLQKAFQNEVDKLQFASLSVKRLAGLLGIK